MGPQRERELPVVSIIAWVPFGARSRELARALVAPCHFISLQGFRHPLLAPLKYTVLAWKTWRLLRRERPRAVIVQNPPLPAIISVAFYSLISRAPFVIDSHSAALVDAKWAWSRPVQRWLGRWALATLVHTPTLGGRLRGAGRTVVLEDPPLSLPPASRADSLSTPRVVVVGSFAHDEPISETLAAAARCPQLNFVLTGDSSQFLKGRVRRLPSNVSLPGWLSFQDYVDLLRSANVLVSLTTRDMTVLRGGWEAVYLAKPLVTSNWPALRSCFFKGAIFVSNDAESIAAGVAEALRCLDELTAAMVQLRLEKQKAWENGLQGLRKLLAGSAFGSSARTAAEPAANELAQPIMDEKR